jgi:hypothetical protein
MESDLIRFNAKVDESSCEDLSEVDLSVFVSQSNSCALGSIKLIRTSNVITIQPLRVIVEKVMIWHNLIEKWRL